MATVQSCEYNDSCRTNVIRHHIRRIQFYAGADLLEHPTADGLIFYIVYIFGQAHGCIDCQV